MIQIITTKNGDEESLFFKNMNDKFFEFLFCDSEYLKKIYIEGKEQNIESLKIGYGHRKADVIRNRISTLIMIKYYLYTNKEAMKRCDDEIEYLRRL